MPDPAPQSQPAALPDLAHELRAIVRSHSLHPRTSRGQHFLVSPQHLNHIADEVEKVARPAKKRVLPVWEIGAGPGNLTQALAKRGLTVRAAELDPAWAPIHRQALGPWLDDGRVRIDHLDALDVSLKDLASEMGATPEAPLVVAGNIPYQISSPLLFMLLDAIVQGVPIAGIVLMVQKEVADRVGATPAQRAEHGALSTWRGLIAESTTLFNVGRGAFWPAPEVLSAVIRLTPREPIPGAFTDPAKREYLLTAKSLFESAFQHRRKMLAGVIIHAPRWPKTADRPWLEAWLERHDLPKTARPENLASNHWLALAQDLTPA